MDFLNPSAEYELLAVDNVPRVRFATGGLLQKSPIVCGGEKNNFVFSQDCVVIGQPDKTIKMLEKRSSAASVVLDLDQITLWVVGGNNGRNKLSSTEFIKMDQPSANGPVLPFSICFHTIIQYDETSIYIIGGWQNGSRSNKTWIVDPTKEFQIKEGPPLNVNREGHGCAKMKLNGRTVLVVAGGFGFEGFLDSVEILDPTINKNWTLG